MLRSAVESKSCSSRTRVVVSRSGVMYDALFSRMLANTLPTAFAPGNFFFPRGSGVFSCLRTFQAVREDLGLQQLVLETCRGHLRQLRTATAAASDGLSLKVGGGASCRGIVSTCVAYGGAFLDGPQDEADAAIAGKAGVKKCIRLAPLLMKEVFRQVGSEVARSILLVDHHRCLRHVVVSDRLSSRCRLIAAYFSSIH